MNIFCCYFAYQAYQDFLPVARILFVQFVNEYKTLYGLEFVTSNIHNLRHVVDEVEKFGSLVTLSAYPFENALHSLKKLVKVGPNALVQVANRILETEQDKGSRTLNMLDDSKSIYVVKNEKKCKLVLPMNLQTV